MVQEGWILFHTEPLDSRRRQEAIFIAMVLSREEIDRLISQAPATLAADLREVKSAINSVIRLLKRSVDPEDLSVFERRP